MTWPPLMYVIKRGVARVLYVTGMLHLWQSIALRRRAVVLMYHRVLTAEERHAAGSHPALIVDRDTFERHMALLKKRFTVLSIDEFAAHLEERRPFPASACVITFDDGWRDNYDNALPILARYDLPSLIFLPMNYIGATRVFWQEALVQLLCQAIAKYRSEPGWRPAIDPILKAVNLDGVLDVTDRDPKPSVIGVVTNQKRWTRDVLERLVAELTDALALTPAQLAATDGFINWPQVDEMRRQRVAFGGHGVDHLLLTQVADELADAEIEGSKRGLEAKLQTQVASFSYPNGYWTPRVAAKVRSVGYRLAFIAQGGPVRCTDDRWTLRRVNIHQNVSDTEPLFLARLVGLF
jgi:peptidoglycan/xylan/chitin deacetylase (PgdA/CDA1 family)